jgi:hypothetical protein
MKTLRLDRAESAAYINGERRFGRAMRKQPDGRFLGMLTRKTTDGAKGYERLKAWFSAPASGRTSSEIPCPYSKPGDRIRISMPNQPFADAVVEHGITRVEVEQRGGRWGWVVEVGA